jgi:hypothetical protein
MLTFVPVHVREGVEAPGEGRSWLLWDDAPPANLTEFQFLDADPAIGMWAGIVTVAVADTHTDSISACEGRACEPFAWGRASGGPDDAFCEIVRAFPPANVTPIVPAKGNLTHCPIPDEEDPANFVGGKASGCNPSPCLDYDQAYPTLADAWSACATNLECAFVYRYRTGSFHLRRPSDFAFPDDPMRPDNRPLLEEVPPGALRNPDDRLYPFTCHEELEQPEEPEKNVTDPAELTNQCLETCLRECMQRTRNVTTASCKDQVFYVNEGFDNETSFTIESCNMTWSIMPTGDFSTCAKECAYCLAGPIDWSDFPGSQTRING